MSRYAILGLVTNQKGLAPILIVILIAAGLGGYLIYQKQTRSTPAPQPTTQPSPSPAASPVQTDTGETANWKTYKNQHYSFRYPKNWTIVASDSDQRLFPPGEDIEGIGYRIWMLTLDKSRGVDISAPVGTKKEIAHRVFERKVEDIIIDDIKSIKVENDVLPDSGTDGLNRSGVKIPLKDKVVNLWLMCGDSEEGDQFCEQYRVVFDQILSTLKFLP